MNDLTITVPCYNSEKYLKWCLESLVIGEKDVEVIVVDDGSTDRTGEIAEKKRRLCSWEEIRAFRPSQYLIMHALVYRTEVLRKSGVVLPEHTFYEDNIFAYQPLPFVETIYYMDIDLYQYYLGRENQSVNEKVLISRIEQQIKVTKIVVVISILISLMVGLLLSYAVFNGMNLYRISFSVPWTSNFILFINCTGFV